MISVSTISLAQARALELCRQYAAVPENMPLYQEDRRAPSKKHGGMAQGLHEVEDVTSICSSLVLNLGTLEEKTIPAMEAAGRKAAVLGLPVILDPVGVTASRFRRQTAIDMIRKAAPSVIRGNEAEIRALNQELRGHEAGNTCGVDSGTFGTIESRLDPLNRTES